MYIEDLVRDYPEVVVPLARQGLVCIRCGEPVWGTLAELAQAKNIENIDEIVAELNRRISRENAS
jgi:hypothetical protein